MLRQVDKLLEDEHALRRIAGLQDAGQLRSLFVAADQLRTRLRDPNDRQGKLRKLIALIKVSKDRLDLTLKPAALELADQQCWTWPIPLPARKPFREAKLRIDSDTNGRGPNRHLLELLADAYNAQQLVLGAPGLSVNQVAKANGRCRKQLAKLFTVSWLSPTIVESIVDGTQPKGLTRTRLLEANLPADWSEQEVLLGFAA